MKTLKSVSIALSGSGGAGVVTVGRLLLDAAAASGWYGHMRRSSGPQIRGGESAVMLRLSVDPVIGPEDCFDYLLALDWHNVERFAAEIPLGYNSVILSDQAAGNVPEIFAQATDRCLSLPLKDLAKTIPNGRPNMVGLGVIAACLGIQHEDVNHVAQTLFSSKGATSVSTAYAGIAAGFNAALGLDLPVTLAPPRNSTTARWNISGNEASGLGVLRGGVRFAAAYPITPASELLEWLAPKLEQLGGTLLQAEDELASINMALGASYGGVPSYTATSGPGLALMLESIGLAVASETPVVVTDVMRGGPSTGIPTKSEQTDLNIALYGLHGEAPHLVLAPLSIADCLFTHQWAVHLAETLQAPALVLSDQSLGQARAVIDRPANVTFISQRKSTPCENKENGAYQRYALTADGVSAMAIPGSAGHSYTADGLEHNESGMPSSRADDHLAQLNKRQHKLTHHDYGAAWAECEGDGDTALITWGSSTGAVREAAQRLRADGHSIRVLALRLLAPTRPKAFQQALQGVRRALVIEQSFSGQFYHYLRAHYDLPQAVHQLAQPGPLPLRPAQIQAALQL